MSDLRWKFHSMRMRHERYMALALGSIEQAAFHARESNRYAKGSIDHGDMHRRHAIEGWDRTVDAIGHVTECGCPRRLWPEQVQDAIKEGTA